MEVLCMSSKLENRLMQYEKSTPISNDNELIQAIKSIINNEEALPYDERDFNLIEEAVEAVLTLQGVNIERLEECAEEITDAYFNDMQDDEANIVKKSINKSVKLKWIIPIAVILSILAAGTIAAYAFGFNLIEMTKKAYSQLVEKETYEEGDHELIITSDCKEYDSFPEFLEKEKVDALLLPYDLPEAFSIDSFQMNDYGEYKQIVISLIGEESAHSIVITTPYIGENNNNIETHNIIGNYYVNCCQYDDKHQGEFLYDNNQYVVVSSSYDNLKIIIESLRKGLQ